MMNKGDVQKLLDAWYAAAYSRLLMQSANLEEDISKLDKIYSDWVSLLGLDA